MEVDTTFISRGLFTFNSNSTVSILAGSMENLPSEESKHTEKRKELLDSCWEEISGEITSITSSQHDKVHVDLLDFISRSGMKLDRLHKKCSSADESELTALHQLPLRLDIPTAVLIAGVNVSDHEVLFKQLQVKICEQISPYTVMLKAKNYTSGIKATMREILNQLMNFAKTTDNDEESEEDQNHSLPRCSININTLCIWYRESCDAQHHTPGTRPPVVIIIEDFEAFSSKILQDLIYSISPHLPEFPVILVFDVATSVNIVHQTLPQPITSLLSIEMFHTQPSALTLAQIINSVLLTHHFPFKLGPGGLNFLLHQFFSFNFSLTSFIQGLKCALMEHFHWQPLSLLCSGTGRMGSQRWSKLGHAVCESVRATPSFQRYVAPLAPLERLHLLENDSKLEGRVKELVQNLNTYHHIFYPLLRCLHHLTHSLPDAPLGTELHELYSLSLERNIVEQSKFKTAWNTVSLLSMKELADKVSLCVKELNQSIVSSSDADVLQVLKDTLSIFLALATELDKAKAAVVCDKVSSSSVLQPAARETTGERKIKFQERLRRFSSHPTQPSAFEIARKRLTDSLLVTFTEHLQAPNQMTLHEAFYFDQVSSLRKHLAPSPRVDIQTALSTPCYYLPGAGGEVGEENADIPDLCILYRLHLECGKLINLYDWLLSFITVVEPDAATAFNGEETNRGKGVDPILYARFIQAVSELKLLGFIKPTQRKTDHVQRLTWGSC